MPPIYTNRTIRTGVHDFKTHIARYIRELDSGSYEALVLVSRRGETIGVFLTHKGQKVKQERARQKELSGLVGGSETGMAGLMAALLAKKQAAKALKSQQIKEEVASKIDPNA
jgi:hypothetical protein